MKTHKTDGTLTKAEITRRRIAALPRPSAEVLARPPQPKDRFEVDITSTKWGECACCGLRTDPGDVIYWLPANGPGSHARHVVCAVTPEYRGHLKEALEAHRAHVLARLDWVRQEVAADPLLKRRLRPMEAWTPQEPKVLMPSTATYH